ncbi:hypothetical protein E2C01_007939 [Portunus trituberculatus]|uniref:Uncharacterized protein n=1 Tax=Portunus trituberculatus TaxID=210409 RepID=A0A5B7D1G1_PORTR|nr:hypothetical protein [Portunus trituberculatus]
MASRERESVNEGWTCDDPALLTSAAVLLVTTRFPPSTTSRAQPPRHLTSPGFSLDEKAASTAGEWIRPPPLAREMSPKLHRILLLGNTWRICGQ